MYVKPQNLDSSSKKREKKVSYPFFKICFCEGTGKNLSFTTMFEGNNSNFEAAAEEQTIYADDERISLSLLKR